MFRDLYKKANDDIKGDRAILDRAFLQAARPVKQKNPVIKYSFIGTAVAAAVVLGAVFTNPSVFTNVTDEIGMYSEATEAKENSTAYNDFRRDSVKVEVPTESAVNKEAVTQEKVNFTADKKDTKATAEAAPIEENSADIVQSGATIDEHAQITEDYGIATMSLIDEEDSVIETVTEEVRTGFSLRNIPQDETEYPRDGEAAEEEAPSEEAPTEASTEIKSAGGGSSDEISVGVFSYLHDADYYKVGEWGVKSTGFVNTTPTSVANADEAIELAKRECTVDYDSVMVSYDPIECVWKVTFYTEGSVGGDESVYLNSVGVTVLIVYGE